MSWPLYAAVGTVLAGSIALSPRVLDVDGFFRGMAPRGVAPGMLTLTLSQVTTWIFARSLMNAAILGYFYGIAGALAYAGYYFSFLTGGLIVDRIRFRHGAPSIQAFLAERFGAGGAWCYSAVIGIRLLSEVFANLLVVGIIFGPAGSPAYVVSIMVLALITLGYSMQGGLRASLRTDVFQMICLLAVTVLLLAGLALRGGFDLPGILASRAAPDGPGWVLLAVAFLQVPSYPMHDPVMMDRGFLADRRVTRASFLHAAWLSIACILAFGLIGVQAGLLRLDGESLIPTLGRLYGAPTLLLFNMALVISAVSTLDSTLSSAAKLCAVDLRLCAANVRNGRIAMALFMLGGLAFLFGASNDLFNAVAVSGTAALFLGPVILFSV
ncbi:MAG TPA: sodium:proline symporter, partial [Alphaproteobacteria bacterium]|nr:sodium:proline symporter [Alphaproteobacteria bacterium]